MANDSGMVRFSDVLHALFREFEMVVNTNGNPVSLFYGLVRLVLQFGAGTEDVDRILSYTTYCPEGIPDCEPILPMASEEGRMGLRRLLVHRGDFYRLMHFCTQTRARATFRELLEVAEVLVKTPLFVSPQTFLTYVDARDDLSAFEKLRISSLFHHREQHHGHHA